MSKVRSHFSGRELTARGPLKIKPDQVAEFRQLEQIGIGMDAAFLRNAHQILTGGTGMDAMNLPSMPVQGGIPVQFLQTWLPGVVQTVTAPRVIDELVGVTTVGNWEDEELVLEGMEPVGGAELYGDSTNIPLASYNSAFLRRTVVRFEQGMQVGRLEEARASRANVDAAARKRASAALSLDISRNKVGFYGYNNGENRTYGFLNDPNLPAYVTVANGAGGTPGWATKTFLEITADIRSWLYSLQADSAGVIDPTRTEITIALPTGKAQYLGVTSEYGNSVQSWLNETYPRVRFVAAPELDGANGGVDVAYVYAESVEDGSTDDNRTFIQMVPARLQSLGNEQRAKGYLEDWTNATAGVLVKRPYAVRRYSGI